MRSLGKLNKPVRITLYVFLALAVVMLSAFWGMSAFLKMHSVLFYGYDGYRATYAIAEGGDYTYSHFSEVLSKGDIGGIRIHVSCTLDGVWVCSPTDTPFRNDSVRVSASDFATVKSYELRDGEKIVTFNELANLCYRHRKTLFVELDELYEEHLSALVTDATDIVGYYRLFFGASSRNILEKVTKEDKFARCYLTADTTLSAFVLRETNYAALLSGKALSESVIENSHERDLPVFATAKTRSDYEELSELRVDYVFMENFA